MHTKLGNNAILLGHMYERQELQNVYNKSCGPQYDKHFLYAHITCLIRVVSEEMWWFEDFSKLLRMRPGKSSEDLIMFSPTLTSEKCTTSWMWEKKSPSVKGPLLVIILLLGVAQSVSQRLWPYRLAPLMPRQAEVRKVELQHSCKY